MPEYLRIALIAVVAIVVVKKLAPHVPVVGPMVAAEL